MNRSNPSTVVGGGERNRDTSPVDIAVKSAGASAVCSSRSVTRPRVSVGNPARQSLEPARGACSGSGGTGTSCRS